MYTVQFRLFEEYTTVDDYPTMKEARAIADALNKSGWLKIRIIHPNGTCQQIYGEENVE